MLDQIQRSQAKGLLGARESLSKTKQAKSQAAAGALARGDRRDARGRGRALVRRVSWPARDLRLRVPHGRGPLFDEAA